MCESLLQSHVPGHLVLLPSLPQVMASQGGSIEGLRARGNAVVSVSWMPVKKVKDSKSPTNSNSTRNSTRNRGGKGHVHKATILFRAPHPWFNRGGSGPKVGTGPIVEDLPGFFSFSKTRTGGGSGLGDGPWTGTHISEVIVVYPESRRPLRLVGSYKQEVGQDQGLSKGTAHIDLAVNGSGTGTLTADSAQAPSASRGSSDVDIDATVTASAPSSTKRSAKIGTIKEGERAECARVIPALSLIPSANITIAANPKKFSSAVPTAQRNFIRQGIGIQIFDFPCRIVLRS